MFRLLVVRLHCPITHMADERSRYSRLAPFPVQERLRLSLLAIHFFSPLAYREVCAAIRKTPPAENRIEPLGGHDFLTYLKETNQLLEADRYIYRIRELLSQLADAHLLTEMGRGRDVMIGTLYYFMRELTEREQQGVLWLAPALGAEFIHHVFSTVTVHLTGINSDGDVRAGTGLVIAPHWLLTCAHVLRKMKVHERQVLGTTEITVLRTLVHDAIDVGLVEVSPALPCLPGLAFRNPDIAETVFTVGYPRVPLSREPTLVMHKGEITSAMITTFTAQKLFLYSAIARPGNSGGPIIATTGHVVGIVTEELAEKASEVSMPFHAGVCAAEITRAIGELEASVALPVEEYQ
jgi:hypothetical protein